MSKTTFTDGNRFAVLLCLTGLLSFLTPLAQAQNAPAEPQTDQDQTAQDQQADPPSRVARIGLTDGSVSLQPGGDGDWAAAARNRPVTVGDKLWSDKNSRVELQAGEASIHLGSMTALSFLNLDQAIIQMRLPEGAMNFRVREMREGDLYEVDTPNSAFTVKQAGAFRVDVSENGDGTRITVIRGEGEVTADGKTYPIHAGERAEFKGTDGNIQYNVNQAPAPDGLDRWANDRDLREENSVSAKYVSRETVGYSDLDDHGTWSETPDNNPVWYPNDVGPDWAPYSEGAWNYVGPWGWTWVGYEPWGFAPYHYGRWGFYGSRWGWCPGPLGVYPIYGPAFVGFLGGRGGFGFSAGFGFGGGIGWFPLGRGEPFHPWFHASNRFINNINIHNTTIHNVNVINGSHNFNYAYAHNTRAVTAASRNTFVNGQAVNRGAAHITSASLRGAEVSNRAGFTPTKQSFTGAANAGAHVSSPPSSVQNRSVMARTAPAAAASHAPVHTMNTANLSSGRGNNSTFTGNGRGAVNNSTSTARQNSQNRPSSSNTGRSFGNTANNGAGQQRGANGTAGNRSWEAQGSTTDRGRAPAGFGSGRPANGSNQMASNPRTDRPSWAGSGASANNSRSMNSGGNRSSAPQQQQRSNAPGYNSGASRGGYPSQSQPRSYSAPSRTYSAPSRSYPAPSRSNSAPSRSTGGGGSAPRCRA